MRIPRNKKANHAVDFINCLTHTGDWSGKPFQLEPFQEHFIRRIFGTLKKNGGLQYSRAFLFIPSGNGKTELCAAIAVYCLCTFPPGQQIVSCGATRKQAKLIFNAARQMILQDPFLASICTIVKDRIAIEDRFSFYTSISSEAKNEQGLAPSIVLFDEMSCQKNSDLCNIMDAKLAKRKNPLFIGITTAGVYDSEHVAWQEFDYARRVESGETGDSNNTTQGRLHATPAADCQSLLNIRKSSQIKVWH